jgi:tryptophan synthase alpha chain
MNRIARRFSELKAQDRAAFIPFVTAGDPDAETAGAILAGLVEAGADLIELGMPFSDPMADGPVNQASYLRALAAGTTLASTLDMVRRFRSRDEATPLVLMGSYNPIHAYGPARFAGDAAKAGVDGLLIVDLPPEEDEPLRLPAAANGLNLVRFVTPTSDAARLATILDGSSGYLYYVSMAGVTGTRAIDAQNVKSALSALRSRTELPCTVGFGIRTPEQAAAVARFADGVVVGTAIVSKIAENINAKAGREALVSDVLAFCRSLARGVHAARGAQA